METMRRLVRASPRAILGTLNDDGGVDLVPVTFALAGPDTLVTAVDHKPKRTTALRRLDNARRRPGVTLIVDHYEDDWSALWWVRLRGSARVVDGGPEREAAAAALEARYPQYAGRPPAGPAIVVTIRSWRGWSAS
jgi:PPOX class probable F420-dependent enzyme